MMRVSELARELGVPTVELLAELIRMGESADSAACRIDQPTVALLRREYGVATRTAS